MTCLTCFRPAEDQWDLDKHLKFADMSNLPFDLSVSELETVKDAVLWNRQAPQSSLCQ